MKLVNGQKVYDDFVEEAADLYAIQHRNGAYTPLLTRFGRELLSSIGSNNDTGSTQVGVFETSHE